MKSFHKYYQLYILIPGIAMQFLSSCKKFVEIDPPSNQITSASVFTNDQTAISAIVGLYSQMMQSALYFTNGGMSVFAGLSADEIYNTSSSVTYDPFYKNAIPSNESTTNLNRFWAKGYSFIYQANSILEGLQKAKGISEATRQQLTGEAKLCRAFCYFYLTNIYGDVPLETTTDYSANALMSRTTSSLVYQQIITDLKDSKNLLSASYPTAGRVRPNKWTASAFLARVYLYQKDWVNAEAESTAVINQSIYNLLSTANLGNVFKAGSNETIWELMAIGTSFNTAEGNIFIPSSGTTKPSLALTANLLNAFEAGDQRSNPGIWIKGNTINGVTYYYPFKYQTRTTPIGNENNIVFRLAEQYLIRAEARAQQNNIPGAQQDLNVIRNRAGLLNTTANDGSTLLVAIEHERQTELFTEWGHRWLDLKRTSRADAVLAPIKGSNWQSTDILYPIPLSEIQANSFLTQNPGY